MSNIIRKSQVISKWYKVRCPRVNCKHMRDDHTCGKDKIELSSTDMTSVNNGRAAVLQCNQYETVNKLP